MVQPRILKAGLWWLRRKMATPLLTVAGRAGSGVEKAITQTWETGKSKWRSLSWLCNLAGCGSGARCCRSLGQPLGLHHQMHGWQAEHIMCCSSGSAADAQAVMWSLTSFVSTALNGKSLHWYTPWLPLYF